MIDQFDAEKVPQNAATTENSVLKIQDNRPDPQAIQTVTIPVPGPTVGAKSLRTPGGMLVLEIG